MDSQDQLALQQLLQLQIWEQRQEQLKIRAETPQKIERPDAPLPERWELTRGIDLHSWQKQCIDAWFSAGKRGVVKVVTGAGKTILGFGIAERLQQEYAANLRVAIVVPTIVLLDQWRDELSARSNLPSDAIGLLGGGRDDVFDESKRILICVLNSAAKKLPELVRKSGLGGNLLLVVDECHRAGAAEMRKIFQTERAWSLGLSATPERENDLPSDDEVDLVPTEQREPIEFDDTVLGKELGAVIFELNYADAIRLGVLPPFEIRHYGLALKANERAQYERVSREIKNLRQDLERPGRKGLALIKWCRSKAAVSNPAAARLIALTTERKRLLYRIEERGNAVLKLLQESFREQSDTRAILFHESIEEVMRIFSMLRTHGFSVVAEHSEFPDQVRSSAIRLFRQGTAQIMVSARSLIEGFNVPAADLGIVVAASSSVRQRVQTLGRLLRRTKTSDGADKRPQLCVLYASDTVDELLYEKTDWEQFTGPERNRYFEWADVETSSPQLVDKAPRSPALGEHQLDDATLKPGEIYPGNLDEGQNFTRDTQGTIRSEEGQLIEKHEELAAMLRRSHRPAGRFRVTPERHYVIELNKSVDGWQGVFLGKLSTPITVASSMPEAGDSNWRPGDSYPLSYVTGKTFSVLQRDPRLIALKERGRTRFVPAAGNIENPEKRQKLAAIQSFLRAAYAKGHRVSKITVTPQGHVVYVANNEAVFVGHAPEGAQGFSFEL